MIYQGLFSTMTLVLLLIALLHHIVLGQWLDHLLMACFIAWKLVLVQVHWAPKHATARVGLCAVPLILAGAVVTSLYQSEQRATQRQGWFQQSIPRRAIGAEIQLEKVFGLYLQYLVEQSRNPLIVRYTSGVDAHERTLRSPVIADEDACVEQVEIQVLTPAFYPRFVQYAHDFEAIFSEMTESHTIRVVKPQLLPAIFLKRASPPLHASTILDFVCFNLIRRLRRRPERIGRPLPSVGATSAVDIRSFRLSSMDAFVLEQQDTELKVMYRSTVAQLFLADRFAFGSARLLDIVHLTWRLGISWSLASMLVSAVVNTVDMPCRA